MGWWHLGKRVLSDEEMHSASGEFLNMAVPTVVTAIWVWLLSIILPAFQFFAVHTTTTKLIYIVTGFVVFILAFVYRKLIVAIGVLGFFGTILFQFGAGVWAWLIK